jgi:O-antigen/teichoic acid export membrane protein
MTSINVRKTFALYAIAFAVAAATPFLLLPLLTRNLVPQQFGEITSFLILTSIISNLAGISSHAYLSVRWFKIPRPEFALMVGGILVILIFSHAALLGTMALGLKAVNELFQLKPEMIFLAILTALFLNYSLIVLGIFQSSGKANFYLLIRVVQAIIEICLCIFLLFEWEASSKARIYSYILGLAVSGFFGLFLCYRFKLIAYSLPKRSAFDSLVKFGGPMMPHIIAGTSIAYIDRIVVSSVLGAESLGIYMVAMQIGMGMSLLMEPLNKTLAPWLFSQLAKNDDHIRRMLVKRTYMLYFILILVGVIVATIAHIFFEKLIGAEYAAAQPLINWLVAGFVFQGMYYSVVNYMFYAEATGRLSMVSVTMAVFGALTAYVLTKWLGLTGAGVSFLINNALMFLFVWLVSSRAVTLPWGLKKH